MIITRNEQEDVIKVLYKSSMILSSTYDKETNKIYSLMSGVPYLLFTMSPADFPKETVVLNLDQIKRASNGKFAIQHHDQTQNAVIWYV
jgi:hypothetical protein